MTEQYGELDRNLASSLAYIHSELHRVQTIAGTLSTIETQHFNDLTNAGNSALTQIAVEEQSAARQLGEVKQICLALARKVEEIQKRFEPS